MPSVILGLTSNGKALFPFAYNLNGIYIITHEGKAIDIQTFVKQFTITESIYAHGLILKVNVNDSINLIEEYKLVGQETIIVSVSKTPFFSEESVKIELPFIVSEYPEYSKHKSQQSTQIYTIVGLSPHIFTSKIKKISRAITSEVSLEIKKILENDLFVDKKRMGKIEQTTSSFSGQIPYTEPLKAAAWLTENAFDINSSPFYLFETTKGIFFRSHESLVSQNVYNTYNDSKIFTSDPKTKEDYIERSKRINAINSQYNVSKLIGAVSGSYASSVTYVDINSKKLIHEKFSASKDIKTEETTLNKNLLYSKKSIYQIDANGNSSPIDELYDSYKKFFPDNSFSPFNCSIWKNKRYLKANALKNIIDSYVHTIVIDGDLNLTAGSVVQLDIQKSIDAKEFPKSNSWSYERFYDVLLSGKYLVTSLVHEFTDVHKTIITIKKDSLITKL